MTVTDIANQCKAKGLQFLMNSYRGDVTIALAQWAPEGPPTARKIIVPKEELEQHTLTLSNEDVFDVRLRELFDSFGPGF